MMKRHSILAWYSMFLRIVLFSQDAQLWPLVVCREMKWLLNHSQKKDYPRVNQTSATSNIRLWARHHRSPVWLLNEAGDSGLWMQRAQSVVSLFQVRAWGEADRSAKQPTLPRTKQRARKGRGTARTAGSQGAWAQHASLGSSWGKRVLSTTSQPWKTPTRIKPWLKAEPLPSSCC